VRGKGYGATLFAILVARAGAGGPETAQHRVKPRAARPAVAGVRGATKAPHRERPFTTASGERLSHALRR